MGHEYVHYPGRWRANAMKGQCGRAGDDSSRPRIEQRRHLTLHSGGRAGGRDVDAGQENPPGAVLRIRWRSAASLIAHVLVWLRAITPCCPASRSASASRSNNAIRPMCYTVPGPSDISGIRRPGSPAGPAHPGTPGALNSIVLRSPCCACYRSKGPSTLLSGRLRGHSGLLAGKERPGGRFPAGPGGRR